MVRKAIKTGTSLCHRSCMIMMKQGWCLPRLGAGRREGSPGLFDPCTSARSTVPASSRPVSNAAISLGTKLDWGWDKIRACKWTQKGCAARSWRPCLLQPCWGRGWWPGAEMGLWMRNRLEKCWALVRDTQG